VDRRTIQEVEREAHGRVQHLVCSAALPSQNCAAKARANFQSPQRLRQLRPRSACVWVDLSSSGFQLTARRGRRKEGLTFKLKAGVSCNWKRLWECYVHGRRSPKRDNSDSGAKELPNSWRSDSKDWPSTEAREARCMKREAAKSLALRHHLKRHVMRIDTRAQVQRRSSMRSMAGGNKA
jgi:hypothetical protein